MEALVKTALRAIGMDIARFRPPLDLSQEDDVNPLSAAYLAAPRPVLLKVPLWKCLTFRFAAFIPTYEGASPFVHTLKLHRSAGLQCFEGSPLEEFYELYQPRTAAELFELNDGNRNVLHALPASGAPLPWLPQHPSDLVAIRKTQVFQENVEHGLKLQADDGDPFYGPVSTRKGQLEFARLIRAYKSIKGKGFLVDPTGINNITGVSLVAGGEWRVMVINSGQHRLAALAALGYETAIMQLQFGEGLGGIVRREDCGHWPLVREGLVTETEMYATFDRVFHGCQPACAAGWLDYLSQVRGSRG